MTRRAAACVVAAVVLAQDDVSRGALVDRATAYVTGYQQQLTAVVADEEYTQEILAQLPADPDGPRLRRLRSEVFFVFEPKDGLWMAIRDTMLVDGRPVGDQPSARQAFETLPLSEVGRRFAVMNSSWNLGRITRNFNEPTLALLVFDERHVERFRFDRRAVSRTGNELLATVEFRERERPTLIRDLSLRPVYSRGDIVMDSSGRIRQTTFRASVDDVRVELTTEYAPNETLGMWVPAVFRERYERGRDGAREHERIACEARYSNYRRFQVLSRVK
jgi:hypothetical protein